jgi:hypothetical protein
MEYDWSTPITSDALDTDEHGTTLERTGTIADDIVQVEGSGPIDAPREPRPIGVDRSRHHTIPESLGHAMEPEREFNVTRFAT